MLTAASCPVDERYPITCDIAARFEHSRGGLTFAPQFSLSGGYHPFPSVQTQTR